MFLFLWQTPHGQGSKQALIECCFQRQGLDLSLVTAAECHFHTLEL